MMTLTYGQLTPKMREDYRRIIEQYGGVDSLRGLSAALDLGYLPPEVVAYRIREAERKAWDVALDYQRDTTHRIATGRTCDDERERRLPRLPDPLAAEPPTLKLSTGEWQRREDGCWAPCDGDKRFFNYLSPTIKTIEDCDKLRAWLSAHGETT